MRLAVLSGLTAALLLIAQPQISDRAARLHKDALVL